MDILQKMCEQFSVLMKILEEAEKKEEPEFHFLVEHADYDYNLSLWTSFL